MSLTVKTMSQVVKLKFPILDTSVTTAKRRFGKWVVILFVYNYKDESDIEKIVNLPIRSAERSKVLTLKQYGNNAEERRRDNNCSTKVPLLLI